jgi:hypothetical protein
MLYLSGKTTFSSVITFFNSVDVENPRLLALNLLELVGLHSGLEMLL